MDGLRVNSIVLVVLLIITGMVLHATNSVLHMDGLFFGLFLFLFGLLVIAARIVRSRILVLICQGLIFFLAAGYCAGFSALAALRVGAPLSDAQLDGWDHWFGLHTERVIVFFASFDVFNHVWGVVYNLTVPGIILTIFILGLRKDEVSLYRLCFIFSVGSMTCSLFNLFFPAIGTVLYHGVSPDIMRRFPVGAGVYFKGPFEAYHSGRLPGISPAALSGVVSFPSFHVVMALMTLFFLRGNRLVNGMVFVDVVLVLLSTILVGGHYFADVAGGAVLFFGLFFLSRRVVQ
ncbi:phosphatase PAP2 family protein [Acetobacter fallax]|uniref:phosphatase PAP2 family protein n=1 Tax=Acetobacter fallax TaxID=1737473 RepID=UPI00156AB55E|nr:hypothetical protein [Acetobacter fallax]